MIETITLRPVTPEDNEFLFRVYASTREEELAQVDWTGAQKDAFLRMQFAAQKKYYEENYPGAEFQIIECAGELAGRLYIKQWKDEVRIMDIALLPVYRGQGAGARLLTQILERGKAEGLPVTIHVERFNPALNLYTRLGFQVREDKGIYLLLEWKPDA